MKQRILSYSEPCCNLLQVSSFSNRHMVLKAFGLVWVVTGALCETQKLLVKEPLHSLKIPKGLALWAAARATLVSRCEAYFRAADPTVFDFATTWRTSVEGWASTPQTSFIR